LEVSASSVLSLELTIAEPEAKLNVAVPAALTVNWILSTSWLPDTGVCVPWPKSRVPLVSLALGFWTSQEKAGDEV